MVQSAILVKKVNTVTEIISSNKPLEFDVKKIP